MEFEIHNKKWKLIKHTEEEILKLYKSSPDGDDVPYLLGYTDFARHEVHLNKDLCFDQQCMTLAHELTHVWIFNSGMYYADGFHVETVCEIVSNCYEFIWNIVSQFIKEENDKEDSIKQKFV